MFKLFVVVMLCVIALHACAADLSVFLVHTPSIGPVAEHNYVSFYFNGDLKVISLPFQITDSYITRIL